MIPKQEQFLDQKPISGTIDEILSRNTEINTDDIEHCYKEIMHEFNVSKKEAKKLYNQAKSQLVKDTSDLMLKEGLLEITGIDKNGDNIYNLKKNKKSKKNE